MHPDDVVALGARDHDVVEVRSSTGRLRTIVIGVSDVRRGVVSMPHGWGAASLDDGSTGACVNLLVDDETGLSPIVGMARQSAVPVWVRLVEPHPSNERAHVAHTVFQEASVDHLSFDGDVVVVTGAARGLGAAYVRALTEHGARVLINDIDGNAATDFCAELTENGADVDCVVLDVVTQADAIVARAIARWGRLDAVVNNAGAVRLVAFDGDGAQDELRRAFDVHVWGTIEMCRAAWPALVDRGGRIVNISSGSMFGMPATTAYATAKASIFGFTRALSADATRQGVKVNAVLPMAYTRLYEIAGGTPGSDEERMMKTLLPAESVAPVVVALAHRSVPCSGEAFEAAAGLVSRVTLATTDSMPADGAADVLAALPGLLTSGVTPVTDMVGAMMNKAGAALARQKA